MAGVAPGEAAGALAGALVEAVQAGTLVATLRELRSHGPAPRAPGDERLLDAAADAVASIGREAVAAYAALSSDLAAAGVAHRPLGPATDVLARGGAEAQRIAIDVGVAPADAGRAVDVAVRRGFRPWYRLDRAAWAAYRRLYPAAPLVAEAPSGHPVLLRIAWRPLPDGVAPPSPPGRAGRAGAVLGRLRPTPADLASVTLPAPLWPAHLALRPLRLARARASRRPVPVDLGPYLPTPSGLVDALLDVAGVGPTDVLVDLGCGDGRILVHAAATRGCRAIGVEHDAELVARARRAAEGAGVGGQVRVEAGDVADLDLAEATVAVVFLSAAALGPVVDELRAVLPPGGRVVAHEQAPIGIPADERCPLFTPAGITIAHRWEVGAR
jgi:hypothetical protein